MLYQIYNHLPSALDCKSNTTRPLISTERYLYIFLFHSKTEKSKEETCVGTSVDIGTENVGPGTEDREQVCAGLIVGNSFPDDLKDDAVSKEDCEENIQEWITDEV